MERKQLGSAFHCNEPTTTLLIRQFESQSGVSLPKDFAEFLCCANGGEGFIGNGAYVILWRLEDLLRLNQAYQVEEYAPGLFLFGSDGGGEAFGFDMRQKYNQIVSVPFVGMSLSDIRPVADTFTSFVDHLSKLGD